MTIKGDIQAMLHENLWGRANQEEATAFTRELLDWMTTPDVLLVVEAGGADINEWIAGINALREKLL